MFVNAIYAFCLFSMVFSGNNGVVASGSHTNDEIKDRLAILEATLSKVLDRNELLENRVAALEMDNAALKESLSRLIKVKEEPVSESETPAVQEVRHLKKRSRIVNAPVHVGSYKRQLTTATIAFTAVVSPPKIAVGQGQTVIYDHVITNVGGAYNHNTGIFTAPVGGVYAFNFAEMIDANQYEYMELVKDGKNVMWNYGHAPGASHLVSSSRTATVEVQRGTQLWIRTANTGSHGTGIVHGNTYTTFSGWLLAPVE